MQLTSNLSFIHSVFYVLILTKCIRDPLTVVPLEEVDISGSLSYEEVPIKILYRQVHQFQNKDVTSINVLWRT